VHIVRKTKIVCTIGPSSESKHNIIQLIEAGMNVARLNFSHGDFEEHGKRIQNIKEARAALGKTVAILLDTKGPEIRLGKLREEPIELIEQQTIVLTTDVIEGDAQRVSVSYAQLPKDVSIGATILIDDGTIGLRVEDVSGSDITCRIINGGVLKSRKGVNVPGVRIHLPALTEKDAADIRFGIEQGIDFIAASFVRKASDVLAIRALLEEHRAQHIHIISKIENQEGVDNLTEILAVSDGLMVARGDLGVEIPTEDVPIVQKRMIQLCNRAGKPIITATQMLDSMQRNPRPTRAEASDVANAIFDGTDATMLSGETAAGKYPVESVRTMARIALKAESCLQYREIFLQQAHAQQSTITEAISQAVANSALDLDAKAIITPTESGYTARMVSKYRPKAPIIAVTQDEAVMRRLNVVFGVFPIKGVPVQTSDELFAQSVRVAQESGLVTVGDLVILTAGVPVGHSGATNLIRIHQIGHRIARGQGIGTQVVHGQVVVCHSAEEAQQKMQPGNILVAPETDALYTPALAHAAAIVTEAGGMTSHAAVFGSSEGKPVVIGLDRATELLSDGMNVTIFTELGVIYLAQEA
jgi:pyruvate kinase